MVRAAVPRGVYAASNLLPGLRSRLHVTQALIHLCAVVVGLRKCGQGEKT
jgi:hypothetical protein